MGLTWALSDGRAGNARQAEALARAFHPAAYQPLHLQTNAPWRWAAPRRLPGARQAFGAAFARQLQQPPALAIGCGRQAALATRLLRAHGSRSVQILDPRLDPRHWDLLVVPEHDALRGSNVLTLLGSLHPVDDAWLAAGRAAFPALGGLPGPRLALLVGGPTAQ
ncbi:ELM1/GtrOC1 family putative glycosyltransferase, partial [Xanthomonas euvesicatoria]